MNRRDFMRYMAASSAVIMGSGLWATSCTPKPNIQWSMGWILWRGFKGKPTLMEAVEDMHRLGLDGIEYTPRKGELEKFSLTRESFRDLLKDKELQVTANYFGRDFYNVDRKQQIIADFKEQMENLKFYGAKVVVIGPPGRKVDDINEKIKASAPLLNELGRMANDNGLRICLHPHVNTIVESPAEIDLIMTETDPTYVGMAPDTGHIQLGGGDPVTIIEKYADRLGYFHLKDTMGTFNRPSFGPNLRELGQGEIDFEGVMRVLKKVGYKGWLNVEQDSTKMTATQSAELSMEFINNKLKPIYT